MNYLPGPIKKATSVDLSKLGAPIPPLPEGDKGAEKPFISPRVLATLLRLAEALSIAAVAAAQLIYHPTLELATPLSLYAAVILVMALGVPAIAQMAGLYRLENLLNPIRSAPRLAAIWASLIGGLAIAAYATQVGQIVSRGWFLTWSVSGFGWLLVARIAAAALVRHFNLSGQLNRRAVIVGGGEAAEQAIAALQHSHDTGITLVGLFDDRNDDRSPSETRGLKKLGNITDLVAFVRNSRVDTLIVTLPVNAENRLMDIVSRLWVLPVDIRISAATQRLRYRPRAYSYIGNLALLDVFDKPLGEWGPFFKAIEDRVIASLALALLSPVMALVALAVKLDSKGLCSSNRSATASTTN